MAPSRLMKATLTIAAALAIGAFAAPPAPAPVETDLSGTWELEERSSTSTTKSTITLTQADGKLSGTYKAGSRQRALEGSLDGARVAFEYNFTSAAAVEGTMLEYRATIVTPDLLKGTIEAKGRTLAEFTAARKR